MEEIKIEKATKEDFPYIKEKLKNYILDSYNISWKQFFVAKNNSKTVAFGRIKNHKDYFEIASLGVDYYYRKKGIGLKMLSFLTEKAKKLNRQKPIYAISHIPDFIKKAGFKEVTIAPSILEYKKKTTCKLNPASSRILKLEPTKR